jgi:dTMP kinase
VGARGRLVAFEGIDGCGKTTQARLFAKRLGPALALLTAEPGGTALGTELRRLLLDPSTPPIGALTEALLIAADRSQHVSEVIVPGLDEGRWVVTDRYSASTFAYQGFGRGADTEQLRLLVELATGGVAPDLNVLVDVPVELARLRLTDTDTDPDRLERLGESFQHRVAEGYAELAAADPVRWVVVDGTSGIGEVASRVWDVVETRLGPLVTGAS